MSSVDHTQNEKKKMNENSEQYLYLVALYVRVPLDALDEFFFFSFDNFAFDAHEFNWGICL